MSRSAITLLGPNIEHRRSLDAMLGQGRALNWLPDSSTYFRSRGGSWLQRNLRRLDRVLGTRSPDYLAHVAEHLDAQGAETVLAYWGTEPLPDLLALRRIRPRLKLVLMVLCYPVALDDGGILRQNWLMRRATGVLDGILFPDEAMRAYFLRERLCPPGLPSLILPPCWPASFQAPGARPALHESPNLIFTGRTDLSSGTIHAADDMRPLMAEILSAGIVLHHAHSRETDDGHPMRRPFASMPQPDLIAMMPRHDASLIAYNTAACRRDERFRLTVPDRLITSVAAGVPVAVPREGYEGLKQYLADYPGLIQFDGVADLRCQLSNRSWVESLHEQAWAARPRYTAEGQGPKLQDFLGGLS